MSDDTAPEDPAVTALRFQSGACQALGSAFSAEILRLAAEDLAAGGPTAPLFAPWTGRDARAQMADAVPLRLLGALHDLALSGAAPGLAAHYPTPGAAGDAGAAWREALALMAGQQARLAAFMSHEPQTNETRRSAALLPGFLTVAAETGLPLRCFEIAASAGLNSLWDQYHYDFGGAVGRWGDASAAVRLDTDWRGPAPPLSTRARVVERGACDRAPVDVRDPIARRRLQAYIWPDQLERLARVEAAIEAVRAADLAVEAANALTWVERRAAPEAGAATVLFHSVFWVYMPPEDQAALTAAIQRLGERATADAPFAWLRMEAQPGNLALMDLRLTLWPGGEDRLLGHAHPHGAWVEWLG
ncbi:DUF2332 domain-containing protein [Caulobacter sp. KR2-114]|uniref:DUF2332 domain-containing protein n=1 Tax=Caulobacter sp. KR2-114 TaxID=3400912 RepID=UPI003BFE9865